MRQILRSPRPAVDLLIEGPRATTYISPKEPMDTKSARYGHTASPLQAETSEDNFSPFNLGGAT
jgi:hypothetical protein